MIGDRRHLVPRSTTDIATCTTAQLRALLALALDRRGEYGALVARARHLDETRRLLAEALGSRRRLGEAVAGPGEAADLVQVVADPRTTLEAINRVRNQSKALLDRAPSDAHREAAMFIYHAATAAALGRHGINLSSIAPQGRVSLYDDLAGALGNDTLAEVFREAVAYINVADAT
jgi:hypothetical protein